MATTAATFPRAVSYDPAWPRRYADEAAAIQAALPGLDLVLHHIGSTSVPGMLAKPIIDLLGEVLSLEAIDAASSGLEVIGYQPMGEFGIAGRRYFRKFDEAGRRTHHLHVFVAGVPDVARHLAFRDYLRTYPWLVRDYSSLKLHLMAAPDFSADAYMDGKAAFVRGTERCALGWYHDPGRAAT